MIDGGRGTGLLDLLLPAGCVVCRLWIAPSDSPEIVCTRCRTRLRTPSWPRCGRCHHPLGTGREPAETCLECASWSDQLTLARYAFALEPPADDLVHALKYEGWRELAPFMARAIASELTPQVARTTASESLPGALRVAGVERPRGPATSRWIVVPVPTTERRVRARGYNQAELLARCVATTLGLPFVNALSREGERRSQTSLTAERRRENVRGAFSFRAKEYDPPTGASVLLVDDVLTTGATAGEAACVLTRAGAGRVILATFARALRGRGQ